MPEEAPSHFNQSDPGDDFQPPNLRPLRALAEREELADACARLADASVIPCLRATRTRRWRAMWLRR
jgi:hypothetical protein